LLGGAYDIIMNQTKDPNQPELIFPYNPRSVSAGWQRVRKSLGIEDLRYHDLRREAASRLAEMGLPINIVARITGHKNIKFNDAWKNKKPLSKFYLFIRKTTFATFNL
jgi:integrase